MALGDRAYLVGKSPPSSHHLVYVSIKYNSLRTYKASDLGGHIPQGLAKLQSGLVVTFADGFTVFADGGQAIAQRDRPPALQEGAPVVMGSLVVFSSRTSGHLYPHLVSGHQVENLDPYPESPAETPYVSVVPAAGDLIVAREDGIVENLGFVE
jgi:hypothetical protein